jgi:hypothetical protein
MRRHGLVELLLELPDGIKSLCLLRGRTRSRPSATLAGSRHSECWEICCMSAS